MARIVTGIANAHNYLDDLLLSQKYYERLNDDVLGVALDAEKHGLVVGHGETAGYVRRVKIAHIDFAWDITSSIMPSTALFGSSESADLNNGRLQKQENDPLHGTACVATISMSSDKSNKHWPLNSEEEKLWNLAGFSEVILIPLRPAVDEGDRKIRIDAIQEWAKYLGLSANLTKHLSTEEFDNFAAALMPVYNEYKRVGGALEEVKELITAGVLERGDIVAITVHSTLGENQEHLPVIHNPWIEEIIADITCKSGVSVIVSAGNSGSDLGARYIPRFDKASPSSVQPRERELFRNNGVSCGAIIVGAQKGNPKDKLLNHGTCIDVFGRCGLSVPDSKELPIDNSVYQHWRGTSIATMVAAATLACVQQIRFAKGILPLKPFEARAHLRQWRSRKSDTFECALDLMGPPPDINDWMIGTSLNFD